MFRMKEERKKLRAKVWCFVMQERPLIFAGVPYAQWDAMLTPEKVIPFSWVLADLLEKDNHYVPTNTSTKLVRPRHFCADKIDRDSVQHLGTLL